MPPCDRVPVRGRRRLRENRHTLETEEQHQRSEQRNQREWLQCTKPSRQIVLASCRNQLSPI